MSCCITITYTITKLQTETPLKKKECQHAKLATFHDGRIVTMCKVSGKLASQCEDNIQQATTRKECKHAKMGLFYNGQIIMVCKISKKSPNQCNL